MPDMGPSRWAHPTVILVATDLSDLDRLMPFALHQAQESEARIILFHVLGTGSGIAADPVGMPYYDPAAAIDFAIKTLEPWRSMARSQAIPCDAVVREGHPAQQIIAGARQFKTDRILLGTRSRSKVSKLLLGSVAEQVLRSVNLPVITVGPEAHLPVQSSENRIVLLATTLRETSRPSAVLACELAAQLNAKLVLLHVLPAAHQMIHEGAPSDFEAAAARQLEALAADATASCNPQIETLVLHGNPFIEILAEATARNATLIVLGTTHRSAFTDLMRDRTVYRVIAHARCPVLTLHEAQAVNESGAEYAGASHSSR